MSPNKSEDQMRFLFLILFAGAAFASEIREKMCPCMAQEGCTKWYAGGGVSFMDLFYYKSRQSNDMVAGIFSTNDVETENTISAPSIGYNVFLGYSYNQYVDVELKGVQIIRPFKNNYSTDFVADDDNDNLVGTTKLYVVTFGPYVLLNVPMYQGFTPYFRFGMVTDLVTFKDKGTEDDQSDTDLTQDSGSHTQSLWAEKFNVGMGFKSTWKDICSLKIEYETPLANTINRGAALRHGGTFYIPGIVSASLLFFF